MVNTNFRELCDPRLGVTTASTALRTNDTPPGKSKRNENKTCAWRSWLHCRSARSPLFRVYTARRSTAAVAVVKRLESTDAATPNTWLMV
ncbi:unnamed protein product [Macrosiphum euphorbiae]|uniref:Uncharacterized protein n=1 Tax=Macrosiphum euphorbiae TaxID=13131 RepID=A0AAV0W4G4_9HEMI|nr:unnamed protein product [Macrosiphum euphorbiae]